jgi:hypothetical protein
MRRALARAILRLEPGTDQAWTSNELQPFLQEERSGMIPVLSGQGKLPQPEQPERKYGLAGKWEDMIESSRASSTKGTHVAGKFSAAPYWPRAAAKLGQDMMRRTTGECTTRFWAAISWGDPPLFCVFSMCPKRHVERQNPIDDLNQHQALGHRRVEGVCAYIHIYTYL